MTDDIVAFIRARLDEDEQAAQAAINRSPVQWAVKHLQHPLCQYEARVEAGLNVRITVETNPLSCDATALAEHVARHDPARVLRGVEAKRRIVEPHEPVTEMWWLDEVSAYVDQKVCYTCAYGMSCNHCFSHDDRNLVKWPCPTMRDLAVEWSTHEDYRSEWTP